MNIKKTTAVLAVIASTAVALPAGASAAPPKTCPPGVTSATYCSVGNTSGVVLLGIVGFTNFSGTGTSVLIHSTARTTTTGTLYLEGPHNVIYGSASYSIAPGHTTFVSVTFTAAGKASVAHTLLQLLTVSSVTGGVRSIVGEELLFGHL